jgi:hypothetical protein
MHTFSAALASSCVVLCLASHASARPAQSPPAQGGQSTPQASGPLALTPQSPGGGSYQLNNYSLDDGTTDSSLGLVLGGTLCWFQRFDTQPIADYDVINEIDVAYGFPGNPGFGIPDGTPATVGIWEDPNDDGDPADAQLMLLQATTVQGNDTQALNPVSITPVTVRRFFFVGVFLKHFQNQFPASRDVNTQSQGRAFFVGTTTQNGTFDPAHLAGLGHTQIFSMDTAGTPPGSLNSVWRVRAVGEGLHAYTYCTPKTNSLGCTPHISATGVPQASAYFGFVISANSVRNNKPGLLIYGTTGISGLAFQGGFLCVFPPLKRSVPRNSGGNPLPTNDCSGNYELDMNAYAHGLYGGSPLPGLLVIGTQVNCQWWGRDPGFPPPNNSTLSDAVEYPVLP